MARKRTCINAFFMFCISHVTILGCLTYPFVITWRFDLLLPENKFEFDFMLWYIMPLNLLAMWCWAIASYRDPGFVSAESYLPLPEKMDKIDKKTLERLANTPECGRCLKQGIKGIYKVEFVHHCRHCGRCIYQMDHHCPWLDNCAGKRTMKPFLLFSIYIVIFQALSMFHMTQFCWKKFNYKGHGMTSIFHVWHNRLNPKFWEADIWWNHWGLFDCFFFSTNSTAIFVGTATFAR